MCWRPLRNRRLRSPTSGLMRCSDWAEVQRPFGGVGPCVGGPRSVRSTSQHNDRHPGLFVVGMAFERAATFPATDGLSRGGRAARHHKGLGR